MFGGIKFRDVIAGAAKAVDEQLKNDIERTKNLADDTAQYHIRRRQERSEQLEVDKQEVEDILEQFASFVDESKLAEGVNKYDYAAQLMATAGGNTEVAKEYLSDLRESERVGIKVKELLPYAQAQTGGRGLADYVNKFVRRPADMMDIPDDLVSGVGLYKLFKPRVGEDIRKQVDLAMPKSTEKVPTFDVKAADIPFELMKAAKDYKEDKDDKKLARSVTELQKQKLQREIDLMGTLSTTMIRQNYNDGFKQASAIAGYDIDPTGNVTSVTGKEQYEMVTNLHQSQLRNAFQAVQNTNSLQVVGMKELLVGYGNTTFNWLTMNGDPSLVAKIEQLDTENLDKMIKGKIYSAKLGGVAGYYLWGGDANSSLLIKESEKT
jgi:hypothetical protein